MQAILAAIGCQQLKEVAAINEKHQQVVLSSMDGAKLKDLVDKVNSGEKVPFYFYEAG